MDPFERSRRRLVELFGRRLREHAKAGADPEFVAADLVAIATGHGWRPVEALQPPPRTAGSGRPNEEFRRRKAELFDQPASPERQP